MWVIKKRDLYIGYSRNTLRLAEARAFTRLRTAQRVASETNEYGPGGWRVIPLEDASLADQHEVKLYKAGNMMEKTDVDH